MFIANITIHFNLFEIFQYYFVIKSINPIQKYADIIELYDRVL